jgi:DDE family transposase
LDAVKARGFKPEACAFDKGYDHHANYESCEERGVRPIIPLRNLGKTAPSVPVCEHGTWTFAGADFKRRAVKYRCPTGECSPKSTWVKADRANPLVPRGTKRFSQLYRGRAAVEREFGRLKNEYGLTPLRVRGLQRVALHADLTMLARLSVALARARAVPLAA